MRRRQAMGSGSPYPSVTLTPRPDSQEELAAKGNQDKDQGVGPSKALSTLLRFTECAHTRLDAATLRLATHGGSSGGVATEEPPEVAEEDLVQHEALRLAHAAGSKTFHKLAGLEAAIQDVIKAGGSGNDPDGDVHGAALGAADQLDQLSKLTERLQTENEELRAKLAAKSAERATVTFPTPPSERLRQIQAELEAQKAKTAEKAEELRELVTGIEVMNKTLGLVPKVDT